MPISIISSDVSRTVNLSTPPYAAEITISTTGTIDPRANTANGVYGSAANEGVVNYGAIFGSSSSTTSEFGGDGVYLKLGGSVTNSGFISGGNAIASRTVRGYAGAGVDLASGTLNNSGFISGGNGVALGSRAIDIGGYGVVLTYGGLILNTGTIAGGNGAGTYGGSGGTGIDLFNGTVINEGAIYGGIGNDIGTGVIIGAGTVINFGRIAGGARVGDAQGAFGVFLEYGGTLSNAATIVGGSGGLYDQPGGLGIFILSGAATNTGVVEGGAGLTGAGGYGVSLDFDCTFLNIGTIVGGSGGTSSEGGGGADDEGTFTNLGTIVGGTGSAGGIGVFLSNGTLINAGTISGGSGNGNDYALRAGPAPSTLIIDPGAVFNGLVLGNDFDDTLVLASAALTGTISGLGSQFAGFSTLDVATSAAWLLAGSDTITAGTTLSDAGTLDASTVLVAGTLAVTGGGLTSVAGVDLSGGDIATAALGRFVVGGSSAGATLGRIVVDAGATISGFGTIGGASTKAVVDSGAIVAAGGTLNVAETLSGPGQITIDPGATLALYAPASVADIVFAAGGNEDLALATTASVTSDLTGFTSSDTIDLQDLRVKSVSFGDGTLTLANLAGAAIGSLEFLGTYSTANFTLHADGHGGTDIGFTATAAALTSGMQDLLENSPARLWLMDRATASPASLGASLWPDLPWRDEMIAALPAAGS